MQAQGDFLSPGFKVKGPSEDAARQIAPSAAKLRRECYLAIMSSGDEGLTADECAQWIGCSVLSARPRISELANDFGTIKKSGRRRKNASGMTATVWVAK